MDQKVYENLLSRINDKSADATKLFAKHLHDDNQPAISIRYFLCTLGQVDDNLHRLVMEILSDKTYDLTKRGYVISHIGQMADVPESFHKKILEIYRTEDKHIRWYCFHTLLKIQYNLRMAEVFRINGKPTFEWKDIDHSKFKDYPFND